MTPDFKEKALIHIEKQPSIEEKVKFIDRVLKFYSEYSQILLGNIGALEKEILEEKNSRDDLDFEVTYRFEEKLDTSIKEAKAEEKKKIDDLIDWLLDERFKLTK